jgi:hypothetical protein
MGLLIVANPGHRVVPEWVNPVILVGGTLLGWVAGTFAAASALPVKYAEFWELGAFGRLAVNASVAACAALAWGMILGLAFGTVVR